MSENLDDLIICHKCQTVHKKVLLKSNSIAKCSKCGYLLYRNSKKIFFRAITFSITALILFIVANIFPILKVFIMGIENDLTLIGMVLTLFKEGFYVVGSIVLVVVIISPLVEMLSYIALFILIKFKILKKLSKYIISFLIISRNWAMVDIFLISVLVALVKLFGYAEIRFGVASIALVLFVIVDIFALKSVKPIELWLYYNGAINGRC